MEEILNDNAKQRVQQPKTPSVPGVLNWLQSPYIKTIYDEAFYEKRI